MSEGRSEGMSEKPDDRTRRGEELFDAVYGGIVPLPPRDARNPYLDNTINQLFGEVWSRDVLSIAARRLLILGAVIAEGNSAIAEIQLRAALARKELTVEQAEEIRLFMVHYVGHPRIMHFSAALANAIEAHKADMKR